MTKDQTPGGDLSDCRWLSLSQETETSIWVAREPFGNRPIKGVYSDAQKAFIELSAHLLAQPANQEVTFEEDEWGGHDASVFVTSHDAFGRRRVYVLDCFEVK